MRVWRNWHTHQISFTLRYWNYKATALLRKINKNLICGCGEIGRHVRFRSRYVIGIIRQSILCKKINKILYCTCGEIGRHDRFRSRYVIGFIILLLSAVQIDSQK